MAKTDVWMPLYVGDYLADTMDLTTEQHGAYLLLLMRHWMKGPIPDNDDTLSTIVRMPIEQWLKTRGLLLGYFSVIGGFWINKRVSEEKAKAEAFKSKQFTNGSKGGRPKSPEKPKRNPDETQSEAKQNPTETPSPSPSHKTKILKHSPDDLAVAVMMQGAIERSFPNHKKPNLEKWADSVRLMRETDSRDLDSVQRVFLWANRHVFWSANILSPNKLREKFDTLTAQMGREAQGGQTGNGGAGDSRPDNSAAGRVRAAVARNQAARAAAAGDDGLAVADDGLNVRPQVGEQLRAGSGPGPGLGVVLEGDFQRSD